MAEFEQEKHLNQEKHFDCDEEGNYLYNINKERLGSDKSDREETTLPKSNLHLSSSPLSKSGTNIIKNIIINLNSSPEMNYEKNIKNNITNIIKNQKQPSNTNRSRMIIKELDNSYAKTETANNSVHPDKENTDNDIKDANHNINQKIQINKNNYIHGNIIYNKINLATHSKKIIKNTETFLNNDNIDIQASPKDSKDSHNYQNLFNKRLNDLNGLCNYVNTLNQSKQEKFDKLEKEYNRINNSLEGVNEELKLNELSKNFLIQKLSPDHDKNKINKSSSYTRNKENYLY